MLAGTGQHDTCGRWLLVVGALGSAIGVITLIVRSVIFTWYARNTPLWGSWLDAILWALWYSLMGLGFLGLHRRYGPACPSSITLFALMTAALQIVLVTMYSWEITMPRLDQNLIVLHNNIASLQYVGKVITLTIGGYALRQVREQSKNRVLMGTTGTGLIVGGILIAAYTPLIWAIASVSSLLAFLLFIKEYRGTLAYYLEERTSKTSSLEER